MSFTAPTPAEIAIGKRYGASIDVVSCMKHVFCTFDLDTSGGLDLTELARLTEQLGEKMDDEEIRMAMSELDVNGDGRVGFEEFCEWWVRLDE